MKKPVRLLGIAITNLYKKDKLNINDYSLQLRFDFFKSPKNNFTNI